MNFFSAESFLSDGPDTSAGRDRLRAGYASAAGRLVAVVVTHDRLTALRHAIVRLLDAPPCALHHIVVVDNASADGTADWLASIADPRLHLVHLAQNAGGAGGFAAGIDFARQRFDPDWYLLLDDDAWPDPGTLSSFHASDLTGWDAVAGAVHDPLGAICDINRPTYDPFASWRKFFSTLRGGREGFHLSAADYAAGRVRAVDGASFVGFFLSRRGLALAGLPDPALFIYADDALQTLKLSRAGGRIGFFPHLRFTHDHPSAANAQIGKPLWKIYYQHRNALILYRFAAGWMFWPICLVVLPRWLWRVRAYPGHRRAFLRLFLRGIWHGLRRHTGSGHDTVLRWAGTSR
ncbi:MAG: glycosyltransferase [Rhodobacteraceae bacterium]|nr:MAG: glycosyltransferase [Paracoccaceae bacterium]